MIACTFHDVLSFQAEDAADDEAADVQEDREDAALADLDASLTALNHKLIEIHSRLKVSEHKFGIFVALS